MKKIIVLAVAGLALVSGAAYAQMQHRGEDSMMGHGMMGRGTMSQNMMGSGMMHGGMMRHGMMHGGATQPKGDTGPSSLAFHGINLKMHEGMDIAFTGNADVDFVKGMIPHHQGAVDMAKTVLAFGKDPDVRKLAEGVIKAQEAEIAQMQTWLNNNTR